MLAALNLSNVPILERRRLNDKISLASFSLDQPMVSRCLDMLLGVCRRGGSLDCLACFGAENIGVAA